MFFLISSGTSLPSSPKRMEWFRIDETEALTRSIAVS